MATTQPPTRTPPAPPPAAPPPAVSEQPPPAPRELRPLAISQRKDGQYFHRAWLIDLFANQEFADCMQEGFWVNVTADMQPWEFIHVRDKAQGRFWAEFIILAVAPPDPRTGAKGRLKLQLLRYVDLERVTVGKLPARGHEVRWLDRDNGWGIINQATGKTVAQNFGTREEALSHLVNFAA
jgi:hypothetical protein